MHAQSMNISTRLLPLILDILNLILMPQKGQSVSGNFTGTHAIRGGVAQWVAHLTRNAEVVGSRPIKGPCCFLEQETLPLLLSNGWFQEWIRA